MNRKYSLKRRLLREYEEELDMQQDDLLQYIDDLGQEDTEFWEDILEDEGAGHEEVQILMPVTESKTLYDELVNESKKTLVETSLPRELSGGAAVIMSILCNYKLGGTWAQWDSKFWDPRTKVKKYARATNAQVTHMANHFGSKFMKGAGRKPSGDGADLEFSNGRAYESKSEVGHKGGNYQLFKEFTSGPKGMGTKLQTAGFAWADKEENPTIIKNGIRSLNTKEWKKFKSIVEAHIEDEGLLVPNYTNGTIYGALNTEVVADWKAATKSPTKNTLKVAQYNSKRRGIAFPVGTKIVGKNASISGSLMSARNELLDKARAEGFDLGKLIKKVFPTKKKWKDYFKSIGKKPPNYATAKNSSHRPNENLDIRAFLVKKKTGKFISFGNYKHLGASQMQGGGQGDIAYSTVLRHADGASPPPPPRGSSKKGTSKKKTTKKSTKSAGSYERFRGKLKRGQFDDADTLKNIVADLKSGTLNIGTDFFKKDQSRIKEALKAAVRSDPKVKKAAKKALDKAKKKTGKKVRVSATKRWTKSYKRTGDFNSKHKRLYKKWKAASPKNKTWAQFRALASPNNTGDKRDWEEAVKKHPNLEENKYSVAHRLLEDFDTSGVDMDPSSDLDAFLFDPSAEMPPDLFDAFLDELQIELNMMNSIDDSPLDYDPNNPQPAGEAIPIGKDAMP